MEFVVQFVANFSLSAQVGYNAARRALNFIYHYKEIMRSWRRNAEKTSPYRVSRDRS